MYELKYKFLTSSFDTLGISNWHLGNHVVIEDKIFCVGGQGDFHPKQVNDIINKNLNMNKSHRQQKIFIKNEYECLKVYRSVFVYKK